MWELIAKIFPPPLIVGVLIYGLVSAIWLQPLIETRLADLKYIPQCKARKLPRVTARVPNVPHAMQSLPSPQAPQSVLLLRELRGLFGNDDKLYAAAKYASADKCFCAVGTAFERAFWRSLVHVMSLRLYTPRAIEHFDIRIAQVKSSGICG